MVYTADNYREAWLGLPVSHARFGGGIILRVVPGRTDTLVSVHFASGLKKIFTVDQLRTECRSLLGLGSFRDPGSDPELLLMNPRRMQQALRDAQWRHQMRQWALESDLDDRLNRVVGVLPHPVTRPRFDLSALAI